MPDSPNSDSRARNAFRFAAETQPADADPFAWTPTPWEKFAADLATRHPHLGVTGFINHGGMGAVYQGMDTRDGQQIAIKALRHDALHDERFLTRFEREIALLEKIEHPHIVRILGHGDTAAGTPFFVMPFLHGKTLQAILDEPRLPQAVTLRIIQQLCSAIALAHMQGIIHRDLKPANIFVTFSPDGTPHVTILDFGIARDRTDASHPATLPGDAPGTHGYMAPEVLKGGKAGFPADIYALGIIADELLSGGKANAVFETPALEPIVSKATHHSPSKRYQTATEFAGALKFPAAPSSQPAPAIPTPATDDEYPTPDPASIVIEFTETSLTVNGLDFSLTTTIEDWMQVLGRYSKVELVEDKVSMYDWHQLGISLRTYFGETETVYIAPLDKNNRDFEYQAALFEEHGSFRPFSGKLVLNGVELPNGFDFRSIQSFDRGFSDAIPDEPNNREYALSILGGRFSFFESIRQERKSEEDREKIGLWTGIQQAAEPPYRLAPEATYESHSRAKLSPLAWVCGAYCGGDMARDPSLKVTLFSISRCYTNQFRKHPTFLSPSGVDGESDFKISLSGNERILMGLGGGALVKKPKSDHNGRFTPHKIILTNKKLIVVESRRVVKSYSLSEELSLPGIEWTPARNIFHIFGYLFGWVIISVPAFFAESLEDANFSMDSLGWLKIPAVIVLGIVAIFWWLYQWGYFFWGVSYLTGGELWGAFWKIDIQTPDGLLKYRLKSKGKSPKHLKRGFSVTDDPVLLAEKGKLEILGFWLTQLASKKLLKFPSHSSFTESGVKNSAEIRDSLLHSCPTCTKLVAKSAKICPSCGENLRPAQVPKGWRQKACSNCGSTMSRFASKCQQPDCGHPNTWIKVQMWVGNGLILCGLLWSYLHFQQHLMEGIAVPLIATTLALAYRTALSMLKSFYGD